MHNIAKKTDYNVALPIRSIYLNRVAEMPYV